MENVGDSIRAKIDASISVKKLIVRENGGDSCNGSYTVVVVSDEFEGSGPLDRQRRVNDVIKDEIKRLHAYVFFWCWILSGVEFSFVRFFLFICLSPRPRHAASR